jgi:hypothetical protein
MIPCAGVTPQPLIAAQRADPVAKRLTKRDPVMRNLFVPKAIPRDGERVRRPGLGWCREAASSIPTAERTSPSSRSAFSRGRGSFFAAARHLPPRSCSQSKARSRRHAVRHVVPVCMRHTRATRPPVAPGLDLPPRRRGLTIIGGKERRRSPEPTPQASGSPATRPWCCVGARRSACATASSPPSRGTTAPPGDRPPKSTRPAKVIGTNTCERSSRRLRARCRAVTTCCSSVTAKSSATSRTTCVPRTSVTVIIDGSRSRRAARSPTVNCLRASAPSQDRQPDARFPAEPDVSARRSAQWSARSSSTTANGIAVAALARIAGPSGRSRLARSQNYRVQLCAVRALC